MPSSLNRDLLAIRPHPSKAIADAAMDDPTIVNLAIGEASYGAPAKVLDSLMALISQRASHSSPRFNRYAHSRGAATLRIAIADRYRRLYRVEVDPETQVLVTHGAAEAIWLAVFTLTNTGDEVLIPDPSYVLYEGIPSSLGRRTVRLATTAEGGFRFGADDLRRAVTAKTRLLILNSPANPTGVMYDAAALEAILAVAREAGIHVLHDEVFDKITFDQAHVPLVQLDPGLQHTIMANSLSKMFGMTGWRLGWMVASPEIVAQALKAHTYMTLAVVNVLQEAVAEALNDPLVEREVEANVAALRARIQRATLALEAMGGFSFPAGPPQGGFYLFPRVERLPAILDAPEAASAGEAVALHLMTRSKVAVVPGNAYGPSGNRHIRLVAAVPDEILDEGLERIRRSIGPARGR